MKEESFQREINPSTTEKSQTQTATTSPAPADTQPTTTSVDINPTAYPQ
jgi:hypothetical protein